MRGLGVAVFVGLVLAGCSDEGAVPDLDANALESQDPAAPVLNPTQALDSFAIAPGFQIELAAAEPLVEDPVTAAWDEAGRLYVAEMRGFMRDVEGAGEEEPIGAVVRLTDEDQDGIFDRREVMLDALVLPRAVRVLNDGLLVGEMGKLWLCPTSSGWSSEIDCSQKRLLGAYGEHQGSVEHAENGLLVGLDNWIYSAKSARRLKVVEGRLIEEPTLFRGQWGITQDDTGRFLYNTNSNLLLGDYYDAQTIVAAGARNAPGLNVRVSPNDEVYAVRTNHGVNRAYIPGVLRDDGRLKNATSASGMVVYQGGRFAQAHPEVFVAEPAANLVAAFSLEGANVALASKRHLYPDDAWGQRDFLASTDERFRPVDLINGPDGGLYVIDFYRGVIQDHVFLSDELKEQVLERGLDRPLGMGRIWRISLANDQPNPRLPNWRTLDVPALVELLDAPDIWRRETAQRLLLRADQDAGSLLVHSVSSGSPHAAVRGLWILKDRGALTAQVVSEALDRNGAVAEAALLAGGHLLSSDSLLASLSKFATGSRAYLYALAALGQSMSEPEVLKAALDALASAEAGVHVRAFIQAAMRGHEGDFIALLVASGEWSAERESETGVIGGLAQQLVAAEGPEAEQLLDYVASRASEQRWVQHAVLTGLFEASRGTGFKRVELAESHAVFAITDDELWPSVSKARRVFTWPGDTLSEDAKPLTPQQAELAAAGEQFYARSCAHCHGADGAGVGVLGPPLAGSKWVTEAPERLARIVLHGLQGPIQVLGQEWNSVMPGHKGFPGFDDRVGSGLLTFLRRSWGHSGRAIDPDFFSRMRNQTNDRARLWTAAELMNIDVNTHYEMYAGKYGRPDAPMGFSYDGSNLIVDAGVFAGPLVERKEDHFLFEPRNVAFEFVVDVDGTVSAVMLDMGNGMVALPRVP